MCIKTCKNEKNEYPNQQLWFHHYYFHTHSIVGHAVTSQFNTETCLVRSYSQYTTALLIQSTKLCKLIYLKTVSHHLVINFLETFHIPLHTISSHRPIRQKSTHSGNSIQKGTLNITKSFLPIKCCVKSNIKAESKQTEQHGAK